MGCFVVSYVDADQKMRKIDLSMYSGFFLTVHCRQLCGSFSWVPREFDFGYTLALGTGTGENKQNKKKGVLSHNGCFSIG
jgi:hypothetical protein